MVVLFWGGLWCWAHLAPCAEASTTAPANATLRSCPDGCDDPSDPDDHVFDAQYQHVSQLCYASIVGAMALAVLAGIASHMYRRTPEAPATSTSSQPAKDKLALETVDTSDDRNDTDDTSTAPSEQDERV